MPTLMNPPADGATEAGGQIDVFPASHAQVRFWLLEQVAARGAFTVPSAFRISGPVSPAFLQSALDRVSARHEALRTTFALEGEVLLQRVHPRLPIPLAENHLRGPDAQSSAEALLRRDADAPFDLATGPLVRARLIGLGDEQAWFCLTIHHIVVDEWSTELLLQEIGACYSAAVDGFDAVLPEVTLQPGDVAVWQRDRIAHGDADAALDWWRERLAPPLPVLALPLDRPRHAGTAQPGANVNLAIDGSTVERLHALAKRHATTPFVVSLAAYVAFLHRHTEQHDLVVGTSVAERGRPELQQVVGLLLNTLALRFELSPGLTFDELILRTRDVVLEAMAHQDVPFDYLIDQLRPERLPGTSPVYQAAFVFTRARGTGLELKGLTVEPLPAIRPAEAKFDLTLLLDEHDDGMKGTIEYRADLLSTETAARMAGRMAVLFAALARHPDGAIETADLLPASERHLLLEEWNSTNHARDRSATLASCFARQAEATPERVAVSAADGTLRYRDLALEAARITRHLHDRGIGPGARVGVCMEPCLGLVPAIVGIIAAGAACVPIDPSNPPDRITTMLEDAGLSLILTGNGTPARLLEPPWETLAWNTPAKADAPRRSPPVVGPEDPAYLLFTSGSTGRPKGVLLSHRGLVNHMEWMQREFPLGSDDAVLQKTTVAFDASIWEFWAPLLAGARLVMAPPGAHQDPQALIGLMRRDAITVVQVVPPMLRALLDSGEFPSLASLRRVFCGGEPLPADLVGRFHSLHNGVLINLYGPTEASIDTTFWVADRAHHETVIPIGRPISNARLYLLDRRGEPVPIGCTGELCIGGDGVALGYLNRPELTRERFVPDHFRPGHGQLIYRTGDKARYRCDGMVECLGRLDDQIKLRGFRIEPGEIEAALHASSGVRLAAVTLQSGPNGEARLVAHVEPESGIGIDTSALRRDLKQRLPAYMLPSSLVVVPRIPLLASGKIDRGALASLSDGSADQPPEEGSASRPDTTLEITLQAIWRRLLGVSFVGLDDDFFALGGHSLLAARMVDELERNTGFRLPLATLFEAATIRDLMPRLLTDAYPEADEEIRQIQTGTASTTPFFMLTGDLTGGGFYCREVAAAAGIEQPVYAVMPSPPEIDAPATVQEMATAHLKAIRRVQPSGPYRFGGYCVGGLVAYEMARQLTAVGERVDLLLLVDPSDPDAHGWTTHWLAHALSRVSRRGKVARLDRLAYLKQRARAVNSLPLRQRVGTFARAVGRMLHLADTPSAAPRPDSRYERTMAHHSRAQHAYRHGRYAGRTDILLSAEAAVDPTRQLASWQRVAPGSVIHRSSSGHSDVVFNGLPQLLRELLERLSQTQSAAS